MARPTKLDAAEIERRMEELDGWELVDGTLRREFRFGDFRRAFAFMTSVALAAEKADHHPNWSNVYDRVTVAWTTHDAGGLTELDFRLAAITSDLAQ